MLWLEPGAYQQEKSPRPGTAPYWAMIGCPVRSRGNRRLARPPDGGDPGRQWAAIGSVTGMLEPYLPNSRRDANAVNRNATSTRVFGILVAMAPTRIQTRTSHRQGPSAAPGQRTEPGRLPSEDRRLR